MGKPVRLYPTGRDDSVQLGYCPLTVLQKRRDSRRTAGSTWLLRTMVEVKAGITSVTAAHTPLSIRPQSLAALRYGEDQRRDLLLRYPGLQTGMVEVEDGRKFCTFNPDNGEMMTGRVVCKRR